MRRLDPRDHGAIGDGRTDDTDALQAACLTARGAGVPVLIDTMYAIARPIRFDHDAPMILGGNFGGPTGNAGLQKLPSFEGEAALIYDDVAGVRLSGVHIGGVKESRSAGGGIRLAHCEDVTIREVRAEHHQGWGIEYEGCWVVTEDSCKWRFCGTPQDGGGRLLNCRIRANSQHWRTGTLINNCDGYGELWRDGGERNHRCVGIDTFGGLIETISGDLKSLVRIESCDRSRWHGTHFAFGHVRPRRNPMHIGIEQKGGNAVNGLHFNTCFWQLDPFTKSTIHLQSSVERIVFIAPEVVRPRDRGRLDESRPSSGGCDTIPRSRSGIRLYPESCARSKLLLRESANPCSICSRTPAKCPYMVQRFYTPTKLHLRLVVRWSRCSDEFATT